ncbi:MAG: hypothetical protein JXB18_08480 [Sedimentisphaerales bacterium]|nr:hypothetical protein [Sedimentisphaerales bacterium]
MDKLNSPRERLWYAQKTIENRWSQPVLAFQIESCLYQRQGKTIKNFSVTLPLKSSLAAPNRKIISRVSI